MSHGHSWLLQVRAPGITYETSVVSGLVRKNNMNNYHTVLQADK